jgi:hypothetical protein
VVSERVRREARRWIDIHREDLIDPASIADLAPIPPAGPPKACPHYFALPGILSQAESEFWSFNSAYVQEADR